MDPKFLEFIDHEFVPAGTTRILGSEDSIDKQAFDIITGKLDYGADVQSGKKLFGRFLMCPHAHAVVQSIDTSKAEALEGVASVITHKDTPGMGRNIIRLGICEDYIYHSGDAVAAVAAVDEDTAEEAIQLIDVNYEVRPFVLDPEEAILPGAPLVGIWPESNIEARPTTVRGDLEAGFMEADMIIEETVGWTARYQHNTVEPYSQVAWWVGDHLHVQISIQGVFDVREVLSACLQMPMNKIHCTSHGCGGGFGSKSYGRTAGGPCVMAAILSRKAGGKPVQMHLSRREHLSYASQEHADKATYRIGVKSDGTLTAMDMEMWGDSGSAPWGPVGGHGDMRASYICPNGEYKLWRVATNKPHTGHWRAPSHTPGCFVQETVIDRICERLDINPLDYRLQNIVTADMPHQDSGLPQSNPTGARAALELVADTIGWNEKYHAPGTKTLPDGRKHGIGLAFCATGAGATSSAVGAIVNMTKDGKALINSGVTRAGGGTNTVMCHLVAETLGMSSIDDVNVGDWGDTDTAADGGSQIGSTRTPTAGPAFVMAALDCRAQLLELAAAELEVSADVLDIDDGVIFVKADPSTSMTIKDVTSRQSFIITGSGYTWPRELRRPSGGFPVGQRVEMGAKPSTACEVAVDTETGEVEILNWVGVIDVGRVLFRKGAMGQHEAGMEVMMGATLFYESLYDPVTGAQMNRGFLEHKMPTPLDLPTEKNTAKLLESIDASGPWGATGMGEPVIQNIGVMPNAIANAIGVRIDEAPITPAKILKALGKA